MDKYRVSYVSFQNDVPKHGSRIIYANNAKEAMDNLEQQHPEFSTTSAKKIH